MKRGSWIATLAFVHLAEGVSLSGIEVAEFFVLNQRLVRKLVRLAKSRFRIDEADAEDLVQDAALEIARSPSLIVSPEGFAFQVFHNRCVRFVERRARRSAVLTEACRQGRAAVREGDPHGRATVRAGLARISPTCRTLLVSYYVEGATLKETAARTGHSHKQVWKRLSACLRKLKESIGA